MTYRFQSLVMISALVIAGVMAIGLVRLQTEGVEGWAAEPGPWRSLGWPFEYLVIRLNDRVVAGYNKPMERIDWAFTTACIFGVIAAGIRIAAIRVVRIKAIEGVGITCLGLFAAIGYSAITRVRQGDPAAAFEINVGTLFVPLLQGYLFESVCAIIAVATALFSFGSLMGLASGAIVGSLRSKEEVFVK